MSATQASIKELANNCGLTTDFSKKDSIRFSLSSERGVIHILKKGAICKGDIRTTVKTAMQTPIMDWQEEELKILTDFYEALNCPSCGCGEFKMS